MLAYTSRNVATKVPCGKGHALRVQMGACRDCGWLPPEGKSLARRRKRNGEDAGPSLRCAECLAYLTKMLTGHAGWQKVHVDGAMPWSRRRPHRSMQSKGSRQWWWAVMCRGYVKMPSQSTVSVL